MGCRRRARQEELVRVTAQGEGLAVGRSLPGRGAWLCSGSPGCVDAALRKGALGRALRASLTPEAADGLRRRIVRLDQDPTGVWEDVRPRPVGADTSSGKD